MACAGNTVVRGEVESLLTADTQGKQEITTLVRGSIASLVSASVSEAHSGGADDGGMEGTRAGEWLLTEEIGRGGMGTVYRARRGDGDFNIEAAVKILGRGFNSR